MKLNQIEVQIRKKSEIELTELINDFIIKVEKFEEKYNTGNWYNLGKEITHHSHHSASRMDTNRFKNTMIKCMKEKFIEKMVEIKSKELLNKLELL
ncbi:MAG: hypothetical protein ABF260_04375 [Flavobacteriaceae bacterium]